MVAFGIGNQIKRATEAIGRPNIGAKASAHAMGNAQAVSLGKNLRSASMLDAAVSSSNQIRPRSAIRGSVHPGSPEGYTYGKKTYLQSNNAGYGSSPVFAKARYVKSQLPYSPAPAPQRPMMMYNDKVHDCRLGASSSSSISRLKRLMK